MMPPDLDLAIESAETLQGIRDDLIAIVGDLEYRRRVSRYVDLVGEVQAIQGSHALDAALEISRHCLQTSMPWCANWVLAAAVELGGVN